MKFIAALMWSIGMLGCGHGQFETARTLAPGKKAITLGATHIVNENSKERDISPASFPCELKMRFGVHERVDMNVGLFLLTGLQWHVKFSLLPSDWPVALAFQTGISGAALPFQFDASLPWALRVPLNLLASVEVTDWFTLYAGGGYQFWWLFNMERNKESQLRPGYQWTERKGYGDGIVRVVGGLALRSSEKISWLFEYAAMIPVVNDDGDNFRFVLNHHFGVALQRTF